MLIEVERNAIVHYGVRLLKAGLTTGATFKTYGQRGGRK